MNQTKNVKGNKPIVKTKTKTVPRAAVTVPDKPESINSELNEICESNQKSLLELKELFQSLHDRLIHFEKLKEDISNLKSSFLLLQDTFHITEDKLLTNFAEIQGIPADVSRNIFETLSSVADQIGYKLNSANIKTCNFKEPTHNSAIGKLIVEFTSQQIKSEFVEAGKKFTRSRNQIQFNNQHKTVFFNDLLSPHQKKLLYDTKLIAHSHNYKFVWIHKSQILVKKTENSQPIYIKTCEDLHQLFM